MVGQAFLPLFTFSNEPFVERDRQECLSYFWPLKNAAMLKVSRHFYLRLSVWLAELPVVVTVPVFVMTTMMPSFP
jgi:hypothetical protein